VKANESLRDALGRQLDTAATAALNTRGQAKRCPPLAWAAPAYEPWTEAGFTGLASSGDYSTTDALGVVRQWAAAFDLTPDERSRPGTLGYRGQIEGIPVEVWAVADRDEFEHTTHHSQPRTG
jgi:hypothetical protein